MSKASRARQRPWNPVEAAKCAKKARQCSFYRNLGKPGRYKIGGVEYRMDESGTLRRVK